VDKIILYIAQNFRANLNLKHLAEKASLSEFHFQKEFKKKEGVSPQKYIEKLRLEYATHLLTINPNVKKINLAFESGFSSPTSFNRSFSKHFGTNPSEYAKSLQIDKGRKDNKLKEQINLSNDNAVFEVAYFPNTFLATHIITPQQDQIQRYLTQKANASLVYGVYLDAPPHKPIEECRYLIGNSVMDKEQSNYLIESGYYAKFSVNGNWEETLHKAQTVFSQIMVMNYRIKEPIAFEQIEAFNNNRMHYSQIKRMAFIPIEKQQDM
jgi:AraC-like DNA-binding protein/DNA gyrase inhibitor GyrI